MDVSTNGRSDVIYGDIHFYLPEGTILYDRRPETNTADTTSLNEVYTSVAPLYVSMTLARGACTMVTRQEHADVEGAFDFIGIPLVNVDRRDYEYNL